MTARAMRPRRRRRGRAGRRGRWPGDRGRRRRNRLGQRDDQGAVQGALLAIGPAYASAVGLQGGPHGPQLGQQRPAVRRPVGRVAPGRPEHQGVDRRRQPRDDGGGSRHLAADVLQGDRQGSLAGVGLVPGQGLPQQDAGGVDVGAGIGAAGLDLFGCQVGDGADEQAGGRGEVAGLDRPSETEVGDLDSTVVGEQDVLGLDVAVNEPSGVRRGQRDQHRLHQLERLVRRQRPALAQQVAQVAATDVLHDEVGEPGAGVGALVIDGHDLGARKSRRRPRLPGEAGHEFRVVGERPVHHLDRHGAVESGVVAEEDRCHAAAGDQAVEAVAVVEQAAHQGVDEVLGGRLHRNATVGRPGARAAQARSTPGPGAAQPFRNRGRRTATLRM